MLIKILGKLTDRHPVSGEKVSSVAFTVRSERDDLERLKMMLETQVTNARAFDTKAGDAFVWFRVVVRDQ